MTTGLNLPLAFFATSDHVLVRSRPDGPVTAVYGPYTKARAEWLRTEFTDAPERCWTVAQLRDFTEPAPGEGS